MPCHIPGSHVRGRRRKLQGPFTQKRASVHINGTIVLVENDSLVSSHSITFLFGPMQVLIHCTFVESSTKLRICTKLVQPTTPSMLHNFAISEVMVTTVAWISDRARTQDLVVGPLPQVLGLGAPKGARDNGDGHRLHNFPHS